MAEMAVTGAVDFRRAELMSDSWWRSLWLQMRAYERLVLRNYYRDRASDTIKLLCRQNLEPSTRDALAEQYTQYSDSWYNTVFPWNAKSDEVADTISRLRDAWRDRWGDPDDPAVQKSIQATIDALNNAGKRPGTQ